MFPSVTQHYKDLLYGAYKSHNPSAYLMEFLEPYKDTLTRRQLMYLIKFILNRETLRKTPTMKTICKEEQDELSKTPQQLLSRFIYYATSLCHVWHRGDEQVAFRYCLSPQESVFTCYFDPNVPISYMWLDVSILEGSIRLIKSNITHMSDYVVRTLWKWTDGGSRDIVSKTFTFDLSTGDTYHELTTDATAGEDVPIVRLAVDGVSGRVGLTQEVGIQHEWPFAIVFSYSDADDEFVFSKMLFNSRSGHLLPLLTSMHPIK